MNTAPPPVSATGLAGVHCVCGRTARYERTEMFPGPFARLACGCGRGTLWYRRGLVFDLGALDAMVASWLYLQRVPARDLAAEGGEWPPESVTTCKEASMDEARRMAYVPESPAAARIIEVDFAEIELKALARLAGQAGAMAALEQAMTERGSARANLHELYAGTETPAAKKEN